jgi:hypothetical protein
MRSAQPLDGRDYFCGKAGFWITGTLSQPASPVLTWRQGKTW